MDSWGLVRYGQGQFWTSVRESAVVNPSEMIALGDCSTTVANEKPAFVYGTPVLIAIPWDGPGTTNPGLRDQWYNRRHRAKWNIAMVDTHLETQKGSELFDVAKPKVRARWNRDALAH